MNKIIKKYNKTLNTIFVGQILINLAYYSFLPFISFYLNDSAFNSSQIGVLQMARSASNVIGVILGGIIADKFAPKKIMVPSLIVLSGLYPLLICWKEFWAWAIVLTGIGFFSGLFYPSESIVIMHNTDNSNRADAFAIIRVLLNIVASIAPLLASAFFITYTNCAFIIISLLYFSYAMLVFIFVKDNISDGFPENNSLDTNRDKGNRLSLIYDKAFVLLMVALILSTICVYSIETTLSIFLIQKFDNAAKIYSMLILINTWIVIVLQIPAAEICKKIGYITSVMLGQLLVAMAFIILIINNSISAIVISIVVLSIGEIIISPCATLLIIDNSNSANMGKYLSIGKLRLFIALPLSAAMGGYLLNKGALIYFFAYALLPVVGMLIIYFNRSIIKDSSIKKEDSVNEYPMCGN